MMRCENMQELKPIKEGKVREIYDNGDSLIMVATDRISKPHDLCRYQGYAGVFPAGEIRRKIHDVP